MDNKQALYSIEQGDDIRYYKLANECTLNDVLKAATGTTPFVKLMDMGEQISIDQYAEIQQSDSFTFSVEMNFDSQKAKLYMVNGGKGGITEDDRTDDNVNFFSGKISEIEVKISNSVEKQVERQDTMTNTKMECTGIVMLSEDSKAKAVATVTINDEFVLKGIKVYEGENGLFASMPSRKGGADYQDIIFPITKEAREQLNSTVLESYGRLVESGLDKLPLEERSSPEQSVSKITVSLHQIDDEKTKAVGQIVIDDSIVITGVKVRHGTNADGVTKDFVSMPSYQTQTGDYNEYAHAVTKECYEKINKAVMGAYETLCKTEYKGVKLSELGGKGEVSSKYGMNNTFAKKLMTELEKKGIAYSARVTETTALSVKNTDRAAVDKVQKDLSAVLKAAQKPEKQTQSKPKKAR